MGKQGLKALLSLRKEVIMKKVIGIILAMALVVTSVSFAPKKVQAADVDPVTDLKVQSYCDYTGKYLIYFTPPATGADGYYVFVDDRTATIATISGSGAVITNDQLTSLDVSTHQLKVAAYKKVDGVQKQSEKVSASFIKSIQVGTFSDIPQVYIKSSSISTNYHDKNDVTVTVVDQWNGSQGRACIDDKGAHKNADTIYRYADIADAKCNIKIRGNSTSTQPKKAYNIKFSGKTSILGLDKGKKWCLLANSMDKSLMRDTLSYNFGLENGVKYTSQSRYVDVYLNGEYKGNYQLCEPVEAKSNRVETDAYNPDNNDILLEVGTRNESDVNHFTTGILRQTFDVNDPEKDGDLPEDQVNAKIENVRTFLNEFEYDLKNNTNNLNMISQYIDVDSFVDYYVANELFKNVDFNFSSTRFYIKDNKLYGGPMWDLDLSSGNCKSSYYHSYYTNGDSTKGFYCRGLEYYKYLFRNAEFEAKVKQRFYDLQYKIQNLYRDDSTEINSIKYLVDTYGTSFERNYMSKSNRGAGWELRNDDGYSFAAESGWQTWQDPINFLKDWLTRRNTWMCDEWGIDQEEAYAKGKEGQETTTPAPTTTTTTTTTTTEAPTTTAEPTTLAPTDVPTVAPTVVPTNPVVPTNKETTKAPAKKKYSKTPAKATVIKAKKSAKKIRITLKKQENVSGYQVAVYKTKKNAKKNKKAIVKKYAIKLNFKIKSKKFKRKKLFVRARAYAIYTGKIYYGAWSDVKKVKK